MVIFFYLILSVSLAFGEAQSYGGCGFCCDKVLAKLESLEQSLKTLMKGVHDQSQSPGPARDGSIMLGVGQPDSRYSVGPELSVQPVVAGSGSGSRVHECSNVQGANVIDLRFSSNGCNPSHLIAPREPTPNVQQLGSDKGYVQPGTQANGNGRFVAGGNYQPYLGPKPVHSTHPHVQASVPSRDFTRIRYTPPTRSRTTPRPGMNAPMAGRDYLPSAKPEGGNNPNELWIPPPRGITQLAPGTERNTKTFETPADENIRYPIGIQPTEEQISLGEHSIYSSCHEVAKRGKYLIRNTDGIGLLYMICEIFPLPNGQYDKGWIVVQNRFNGSESFYRSWEDYVAGFGNLDGEFWLGLDLISKLVNNGHQWELMFWMTSFQGESKYQRYRNLKIGDESDDFTLKQAHNAGGDAGDSFSRHQTNKFTTYDRDNDKSVYNCAKKHQGGWWYHNQCTLHSSNLNGFYTNAMDETANSWHTMRPTGFGLKATKIMIRQILT